MMTKEEFFKSIGTMNRYMLLDRMRSDCLYVLGACGGSPASFKYLWAKNPQEQIAYMRYLLDSFPAIDKPDWISAADIDEYETKLVKEVVA